jgi:hypothetical protein
VTSTTSDRAPLNNSKSVSTTVVGLNGPSIDFGDQAVGSVGPPLTSVITNGSAQPVTFPQVNPAGDLGDFLGVDTCSGATVPPSGTCAVAQRFLPSALGDRSATLTFDPTAGQVDTLVLGMSGRGVAAAPVSGPAGPPGADGAPGPAGQPGATGPQGPPAFKLVVVPVNSKLHARAGKRVPFAYVATTDAKVTLEVLKKSKRVAQLTGSARTGANKLTWNGKAGRKAAPPGAYTLRLTAVSGSQTTSADAKLTLTRR